MKKKLLSIMLLLVFTSIAFAGFDSLTHRTKNHSATCYDADGKFIESKTCDPNSCGCLYHELLEFIGDMF